MRDEASAPRVAIRTVGCRLNQAESAQIAATFQSAGYVVVGASEACDVFIVHSCTITSNAESDSSRLARAAARRDPRPVVVVAGCAVEVDGDTLAERSQADLVVGQGGKFELPALLAARLGDSCSGDLRGRKGDGFSKPLEYRRSPNCRFRITYIV